jgi:thiamine pyrophosphokinase
MKRAIIFANGKMEVAPSILAAIHTSDLIIAADGGTQHCKSLKIKPNVIIGDFDSVSSLDINSYQQAGVETIQYTTNKDETDLELALLYALNHQTTHVYIFGALGKRWDMTIANILLGVQHRFSQLSIRLLDGRDELIILRGEGREDIMDRKGDTVSLIPVGGDALGITTDGMEYPLNDETLYLGSSRGVSNVIISDKSRVIIKTGTLLLCISSREVY